MTKTNTEEEELLLFKERLTREGTIRGGSPIGADEWKRNDEKRFPSRRDGICKGKKV